MQDECFEIILQDRGFAASAGMWRPCGAALTLALSRTAQRNVFAVRVWAWWVNFAY